MRFAAGGVATIHVALVLTNALSFAMQFVPSSEWAGAILLALASIISAFAFRFHSGAETIRDLPGILMVGAVIAAIAVVFPQAAVQLSADAATGMFAQATQLTLVLAEAHLGLAIASRFL